MCIILQGYALASFVTLPSSDDGHIFLQLPRLWAVQLGCIEGLPESVPEELLQDDTFLQKFHHALLEVRQQR